MTREERAQPSENGAAVGDDGIEPVLRVSNLHAFTLDGLDLELRQSENVAVIGESGSGKSVLLRCILGLHRPKRGEVVVLGRRLSGKAIRHPQLGVAFQDPGLFDAWTVGTNLQVAGSTRLSEEEIRTLLDDVGLDSVKLSDHPANLSGGQQKRVSLLRAFLRGTQLLILDEPTSGLDPLTAEKVSSLLTGGTGKERAARASLVITHDYRLALALADRILVLTSGKLTDCTPASTPTAAEREEALRQHLKSLPRVEAARASKQCTRKWGFLPIAADFLCWGLLLSVAALALLGAMLVAQSVGVSQIDVSRWVPRAIVIGVYREIAPLVVGLLLASRIASRISAEIGGMGYTAQLDSMKLLGISPVRKLLLPFLLGGVVTFPLCIEAGAMAAILGGSAATRLGLARLSIGANRFLYLAQEAIEPMLLISCVVKGICMGTAVTIIAYVIGSKRVDTAAELGGRVTLAAVAGALAVVGVDAMLTWVFFRGGLP